MTDPAAPPPGRRPGLAFLELKHEVEEFLYHEADLIDQRRFRDWLDLLAEDLVYFMPMRRNVKFGEHAQRENTRFEHDMSWFNEDKWTLARRVEQILTGCHWAEEPMSRVCHLVASVRLLDARPSFEQAREAQVRSRFIVYQNRVEHETALFAGKRTDLLRRDGDRWLLARREIILDQSVLLAKNLTTFF
jgi:3-phenylpropionate/cinnamic acid dioxygenase small subunit